MVEDSLEEVIWDQVRWDQVGWAWECSSTKLKELRRLVHMLQQHEIYSCIYKDIYMFGITDKVRSLKYKTKDHNNILWTKEQIGNANRHSFILCISFEIHLVTNKTKRHQPFTILQIARTLSQYTLHWSNAFLGNFHFDPRTFILHDLVLWSPN
jgi:hypothetical protein